MAEDAKVEEKDNFDVGPLSVLQKCVKDNSQAWNIKAGKMFRFDLSSCTLLAYIGRIPLIGFDFHMIGW